MTKSEIEKELLNLGFKQEGDHFKYGSCDLTFEMYYQKDYIKAGSKVEKLKEPVMMLRDNYPDNRGLEGGYYMVITDIVKIEVSDETVRFYEKHKDESETLQSLYTCFYKYPKVTHVTVRDLLKENGFKYSENNNIYYKGSMFVRVGREHFLYLGSDGEKFYSLRYEYLKDFEFRDKEIVITTIVGTVKKTRILYLD